MKPRVAFIIVSYNTRDLLEACLASIYQHTRAVSFEIVVVDNASRDTSVAMVREKFPEVILIESQENLGFGRANNLGFERTEAPFVLFFNSDALLLSDAAATLTLALEARPRAGVAGPAVILRDGRAQPKTRGMLPTTRVMLNQNLLLSSLFPRSRFFAGLYVEQAWATESRVGWVSGVCMLMRREAFAESGGFDPTIFMYAEDVDLCRRCAALGWETWRIENVTIQHLCGGSTKTEQQMLTNRVLQQRNFLRMLDRSMGPTGRVVTRLGWMAGLIARALLRGTGTLLGDQEQRLAFRADLQCLRDFLGFAYSAPKHSHAHRP